MCQFLRVYNVGRTLATELCVHILASTDGRGKAGLRTLDELAAADAVNGRKISSSMKVSSCALGGQPALQQRSANPQLSIKHLPDMERMIPRREMNACKARLDDVFYGYPEPECTLHKHTMTTAHSRHIRDGRRV